MILDEPWGVCVFRMDFLLRGAALPASSISDLAKR